MLNRDGTKKIEVSKVEKLGQHNNLAQDCADFVIKLGGKRLMDELQIENKRINVYSTKALTIAQSNLFHNDIAVDSSDFIQISLNRLIPKALNSKVDNVIITSKNAVESLITNFSTDKLKFKNIYCVGRRTKRLVEKKIGKVKHTENNAKNLAKYLVEYIDGTEVTYFCSDLRLEDLPSILEQNNIKVNEVEAYQTKFSPVKIDVKAEGIMFYSPSTVKSYMLENDTNKIASCIGETTAEEAKKYFKDVRIAKVPTVESVIELVNLNYI